MRRSIIPWIFSFHTERRQCVRFGQSISKWLPVDADVLQGTKIGPIPFVVMINDLKLAFSRCSIKKYVDDITVWEIVLARDTSVMQSELDKWINQWNTQNNMVLNPKKCKEMVVRCRRHVEHSPPALTIDNKTLERADSHKVLVVILQSNLKWDPPISKIVGKASKRLHILRVLKRGEYPL